MAVRPLFRTFARRNLNRIETGTFINIGNAGFLSALNGEYVDKSELIAVVNGTLFTERRFSCVTRCRRFGKSLAAKMLCAYYDRSCDSRQLFANLKIANDPSFDRHLNKYPVLYLDMSAFTERFKNDSIVDKIKEKLREELIEAYPQVKVKDDDDLMEVKAWTYKKGWKAPLCAGVIHTDFEKGFIRAEVIKYADYLQYGSEAAVREAGKLAVEGKDYVVQDGDIMHFRFNV